MARRTEKKARKQVRRGRGGRDPLQELLFPLARGIEESRASLLSLVQEAGLHALGILLDQEAESVAGRKHQHQQGRTAHHWGSAASEVGLGGRKVQIDRPRIRSTNGRELQLASFAELQLRDPLPERVMEQVLLGVSTRGYERSLPEPPPEVATRGASKSAASRRLVQRTREQAAAFLSRRLDDVDLAGVMLDGLEIDDRTVVGALGITSEGRKLVLGLWQGSTENKAVCIALLQNLLARGLRIRGRLFVVIDGGKGLRAALRDVLGDLAVVQRCQLHKIRNVKSHLPEKRHAYVAQVMRDAYGARSVATARTKLRGLVAWLDRNGEVSAAASLTEGMEETLTILRFGLSSVLRRFFSTTNAIENLNGLFRRDSRNVKNWRDGEMVQRWVGMSFAASEKRFHRIKGHRDLHVLVTALRQTDPIGLEAERESA